MERPLKSNTWHLVLNVTPLKSKNVSLALNSIPLKSNVLHLEVKNIPLALVAYFFTLNELYLEPKEVFEVLMGFQRFGRLKRGCFWRKIKEIGRGKKIVIKIITFMQVGHYLILSFYLLL